MKTVEDVEDLSVDVTSEKSNHQKVPQQPFDILQGDIGYYTEHSNTIFYYGSYRVAIVLDLSRSAFAVTLASSGSYYEKVQESLEAILNSLIFKVDNRLQSLKKDMNQEAETSQLMGGQDFEDEESSMS